MFIVQRTCLGDIGRSEDICLRQLGEIGSREGRIVWGNGRHLRELPFVWEQYQQEWATDLAQLLLNRDYRRMERVCFFISPGCYQITMTIDNYTVEVVIELIDTDE